MTTTGDRTSAEKLAEMLVEQGLVACANITSGVTSIYRWQGRIEHAQEFMLTAKTTSARYQALEARLREVHPYELPEILAVPITHVLDDYLQWIKACTDI